MTQAEAISILLKHGTEDEVTSFLASSLSSRRNYFKNLTKEELISDYTAKKYTA